VVVGEVLPARFARKKVHREPAALKGRDDRIDAMIAADPAIAIAAISLMVKVSARPTIPAQVGADGDQVGNVYDQPAAQKSRPSRVRSSCYLDSVDFPHRRLSTHRRGQGGGCQLFRSLSFDAVAVLSWCSVPVAGLAGGLA
jgi:hypothetical protein